MRVYDYERAPDYSLRSLANVYNTCLRDIVTSGWKVGPRGKATLELNDVALRFPQMCGTVSWNGRRLNPFFLLSEMLWIVSGADETSLLEPHMPSIVNFYDDGKTFGAYGPRFSNQIDGVIQTLKSDPNSRQAVMTMWRPSLYTEGIRAPTRDVPCTVMLHFRLVKHPQAVAYALNTTVYMRSNDMYKGFPYDTFNFGMIQAIVAAAVGAKMGTCTHIVGSAHVYQEDLINVIRHGQDLPGLTQSWSSLSKDLANFNELTQDVVLRNLCQMRDMYRARKEGKHGSIYTTELLVIPTGIEIFDTYTKILARKLDAKPNEKIDTKDAPGFLRILIDDYYGEES